MPQSDAHVPIADLVLGVPGPVRGRRLLIAVLVAVGAHGSLWLWAQRRREPPPSVRVAGQTPGAAPRELDIELLAPAPPPPSDQTSKTIDLTKVPPRPRLATRSRPAAAAPVGPAPPAQAGSVLAQDPDAPVDLTGATWVTGSARAYAGGVTASQGTNTTAVATHDVEPAAPPAPGALGAAPSRASAVSLADQRWSCPWPREADAEQIDQQTVVIRVVVGADGKAESAKVVSDPGHGFGEAATACALRTRFTPARDRAGEPVRAASPPIRVTFTR